MRCGYEPSGVCGLCAKDVQALPPVEGPHLGLSGGGRHLRPGSGAAGGVSVSRAGGGCGRIFDRLAKHAGAGTLVPITGFANAVAAPALEFRSEGFTTGTCVKMFTIAGPVLVYGITASVLYGLILCLLGP